MPKPRRPKLGQHFLADVRYRSRIVQALGLRPDDLVIEIGPGHGAITPLVAAQARQVAAVELDPALAAELQQKFQQEPRVEVINADILATDLAAICRRFQARECFVFGNLPYYITSPILHHLLEFAGSIRAMGLLVQREVARTPGRAPRLARLRLFDRSGRLIRFSACRLGSASRSVFSAAQSPLRAGVL